MTRDCSADACKWNGVVTLLLIARWTGYRTGGGRPWRRRTRLGKPRWDGHGDVRVGQGLFLPGATITISPLCRPQIAVPRMFAMCPGGASLKMALSGHPDRRLGGARAVRLSGARSPLPGFRSLPAVAWRVIGLAGPGHGICSPGVPAHAEKSGGRPGRRSGAGKSRGELTA